MLINVGIGVSVGSGVGVSVGTGVNVLSIVSAAVGVGVEMCDGWTFSTESTFTIFSSEGWFSGGQGRICTYLYNVSRFISDESAISIPIYDS